MTRKGVPLEKCHHGNDLPFLLMKRKVRKPGKATCRARGGGGGGEEEKGGGGLALFCIV